MWRGSQSSAARGLTRVPQRGLTMVELILFLVIVGVALTAILAVLGAGVRPGAEALRTKQALMIAQALLEEVERAGFTWCDPASVDATAPTSSSTCAIAEDWGQASGAPAHARPYDNVNDYASGADRAEPAFDVNGVLADASGRALAVPGYTASVTITPQALGPAGAEVGAAVGTATSAADTDMLRIRVTVSFDQHQLALDGYRARYAPAL